MISTMLNTVATGKDTADKRRNHIVRLVEEQNPGHERAGRDAQPVVAGCNVAELERWDYWYPGRRRLSRCGVGFGPATWTTAAPVVTTRMLLCLIIAHLGAVRPTCARDLRPGTLRSPRPWRGPQPAANHSAPTSGPYSPKSIWISPTPFWPRVMPVEAWSVPCAAPPGRCWRPTRPSRAPAGTGRRGTAKRPGRWHHHGPRRYPARPVEHLRIHGVTLSTG
jgi:hypothetical protein